MFLAIPAAIRQAAKREKISTGAYVRSSKVNAPLAVGAKLSKKVDLYLEQLGIGMFILPLALLWLVLYLNLAAKPSLPTAAICQAFDELRQDVVTLLELKKTTDRLEYETKLLRQRKSTLEKDLLAQGNSIDVPDFEVVGSGAESTVVPTPESSKKRSAGVSTPGGSASKKLKT